MTTLQTIKEEPELSIIDDPYVPKLCLWQIDSVHTSIERIEETVQDSTMERIMKATVSVEKEKLIVNVHSTTKEIDAEKQIVDRKVVSSIIVPFVVKRSKN